MAESLTDGTCDQKRSEPHDADTELVGQSPAHSQADVLSQEDWKLRPADTVQAPSRGGTRNKYWTQTEESLRTTNIIPNSTPTFLTVPNIK